MKKYISILYKYKYLFVGLFIAVALALTIGKSISFSKNKPIKQKKEFDLIMDQLYLSLQESNSQNSCLEANAAAKLIKDNFAGFKKIEPYYQWLNIEQVLTSIAKKNCQPK